MQVEEDGQAAAVVDEFENNFLDAVDFDADQMSAVEESLSTENALKEELVSKFDSSLDVNMMTSQNDEEQILAAENLSLSGSEEAFEFEENGTEWDVESTESGHFTRDLPE